MTVHIVNVRPAEANTVTSPAAKTSQTPEMAFIEALQSSVKIKASLQPSFATPHARAEVARAQKDDRPAKSDTARGKDRNDDLPAKAQAPDRSSADLSAGRADARKGSAPAAQPDRDQTDAAQAAEPDDDTSAQQAADPTVVQPDAQAAAMVVQPQQPQAIVAAVQANSSEQADGETPAVASDDEGAAPSVPAQLADAKDAKAAAALQAAPQANAEAAPAAQPNTTAPADRAAAPTPTAQNLAEAQASEMAKGLSGTGANIKIKVKTTDAGQRFRADGADTQTQQTKAPTETQTAASTMAAQLSDQAEAGTDTPAAQQAFAVPSQQATQADTMPGLSASQSGAMPAMGLTEAQAQAQTQTPIEAGTFAAALAGETQAASGQATAAEQQTSQPQPQPTQIAGLNAAQGTTATQRSAPAQAAQSANQARFIDHQDVVEQISVEIQKQSKDGNDTIKLQLKPAELGRIEIKLEVGHDGKVTAVVTADNKDTLAMLQKDSGDLTKALADAGLKSDAGSLSFNLRGEQQQQAGDGNQGQGRRFRRLGNIDGSTGPAATAAAQAAQFSGRGKVDIKV